jgi:signal transduction histidine kinase
MRSRLALSAAAVTTMVVVAFVLPLGYVVKVLAGERAIHSAQLEAQVLAAAVATVPSREILASLVEQTNARSPRPATVYLTDGETIGSAAPVSSALDVARRGRAFTAAAGTGRAVWVPVQTADGTTTVVRVGVPGSLLTRGVMRAWGMLAAVGVALIGMSVLLADRLARSLVQPMRALAAVTRRLEGGELSARVSPAGPPEVASIGYAVNSLADRIGQLVAAEREEAADVSHRLRTPLAALRLDAEGLADPLDRARVAAGVDALERAISQVIHEARQAPRQREQRSCDLAATTRTRAAYWAALAKVQRRPCQIDLPLGGVIEVGTTASDLAGALDALVANVFVHTPEGTGFRIAVQSVANRGLLTVEDDGPGFPAGLRPSRGRSTVGSTGLGLDIARKTAEGCGGGIRLGRSATGGARIELVLPATARRAPTKQTVKAR